MSKIGNLPGIMALTALVETVINQLQSAPKYEGEYEHTHDLECEETFETITIGWNPNNANWDRQIGSNEFFGEAYLYPIWAVVDVTAGDTPKEIAEQIRTELADQVTDIIKHKVTVELDEAEPNIVYPMPIYEGSSVKDCAITYKSYVREMLAGRFGADKVIRLWIDGKVSKETKLSDFIERKSWVLNGKHGELPIDEFYRKLKSMEINKEDVDVFWATDTVVYSLSAWDSKKMIAPFWATHVVWFNK